ncbi:hypothetical protein [Clostridium sporogenes]|uniref:hypothetical protein n=1 Tax=Clostridium sporogenes TaxID=1509 RepID=UPI0013CF6B83|nr:hypothetical protein [Clostridium sporogenes]
MNKRDNLFFYFGRLNIICPYTKQRKQEYIYKSLNTCEKIIERNFKWGLFYINRIEYNNEVFVTGYLVKYKEENIEEVVDEDNRTLKTTKLQDKIIAKSEFILHLSSGLIAYRIIRNVIGNEQFKKQFSKLIEKANNNCFINAEIQGINDEVKIFKAIKEFDIITSLYLTLHPSNPSNRQRWKETDEKLHKMQVEKYIEKYISKKGIIIEEDDQTFGNIIMAADGYGEAKIKGTKDGKQKEASTRKMQIKSSVPNMNMDEIIKFLYKDFKNILERFKNKK